MMEIVGDDEDASKRENRDRGILLGFCQEWKEIERKWEIRGRGCRGHVRGTGGEDLCLFSIFVSLFLVWVIRENG